jgi:hypothetical protein
MKEQLNKRGFAEDEELLSVLSDLMNEITSGMISRVLAEWDQRLWLCLLMEGE